MPAHGSRRAGDAAEQSVGNSAESPDTKRHSDTTQADNQTRPIDEIIVGERVRRDMGDIEALAASIDEIGLLNPIVVTPDGRLLCGERRLLAAKLLGWKEIPVTIRGVAAGGTR